MPFGSLYIQSEKWHSTHQIIQHNETKQLQTKTVNKEPEATQFANKSAAVGEGGKGGGGITQNYREHGNGNNWTIGTINIPLL